MQSCLAWLSLSCSNNLFLFFVVFYYACNVYYSWCVFICWNTLGKRNRGSGRVWSHPRPDPIKHTPQPHGWLTRPKCCWNFWVGFLYFIFFLAVGSFAIFGSFVIFELFSITLSLIPNLLSIWKLDQISIFMTLLSLAKFYSTSNLTFKRKYFGH